MKKINFQNGASGKTPLNKTNMNLLQTNIEDEFKKLLNALSNNKATVTGETIDIRDSAEERVYEFNISGNSKQETSDTSPSSENPSEIRNAGDNTNEFDKDNAPEIVGYHWDNSVITSSPTLFTTYIKCESNTTYTVSKISGQRFALGTTEKVPAIGVQTANLVQNNTATSLKITTSNTAKYLIVGYYNSSADTLSKQEILDSIKIEKGSKATPYSPHNCGNVNITVCNKNFLDHNIALYTGNYNSNGEHIVNSDMCIKDYIFFKASTYVAIAQNNTWINVNVYDLEKKFIKSHNSQTNKKVKFTLEKDSFIRIAFNPIVPSLSDFMIIKESSTEDWLEHQSQGFTFPLSEGQRLYKDSYLSDDGIHQKRRQVVFNGTETKFVTVGQVNSVYRYNMSILDIKPGTGKAICSHYKQSNEANFALINENCIATHPVSKVIAFFTNFPTLDEFKAYLAEQHSKGTPVTVEYELETEIIEPYTEEQLKVYSKIKNELKTYKGITHIYSTDEISPIFEVRYIKDIEIMMNN